jgi:hypothetical protein
MHIQLADAQLAYFMMAKTRHCRLLTACTYCVGRRSAPLGPEADQAGRKNGRSRAIIATARKLAVLLHHLWVSGEVYQPLHNGNRLAVAAAG